MSEQSKVTPEQQATAEENAAAGAAVSLRWMRSHPDFTQCPENGKIISDWVKANKAGDWSSDVWTAEILDEAFEATKDRLTLKRNETTPITKRGESDWGKLSMKDVKVMSAVEMRQNMKDPAFRDALGKLGIGS